MDDPGNGGTVRDGYIMRVRNFLIPLCFLVLLALAIPVIAAADTAQVNNVTTTDTIAPIDTATPVATPGFDPLGELAVVVGIRKDNHTVKADNPNLTNGVRDNRTEVPANWWDSYNIFSIIIGKQTPVRNEPALNITPQMKRNDTGQPPRIDRVDLQKDAVNASIYRADINMTRNETMPDRVNLSVTHQDIRDVRNVTPQTHTNLSEPQLSDVRISRTNNASLQAAPQNDVKIRADRQQISNESRNKNSSP